jgi:hypothetical protein
VDADLRALERRAAAGEPLACFELARARERVGDAAGALEALWGACGTVAGRREVARFAVRAFPPRETPRVAWEVRAEGRSPYAELRATPFGLLATSERASALLHPVTGKRRATLPGGRPWLHEETGIFEEVKGKRRTLHAVDLWTGEWLFAGAASGEVLAVGAGALVTLESDEVSVQRFVDLRERPVEAWRAPRALAAAAHADTIALARRDAITLHAAKDGAVSSIIEGARLVALDAHGLLADARPHPSLPPAPVALHLDGQVRWRLDEAAALLDRGDDTLAYGRTAPGGAYELLLVDRATGAVRAREALPAAPARVDGDLIFVTSGRAKPTLTCLALGGEPRWTWSPAKTRPTSTVPLALMAGRVFVIGDRRTLASLSEETP